MTWSESCVIVYTNIANQGVQLEIKDAKLYVPVITLSIEDNEKLLSQLKPDFERTIKWNKYLTKPGLLRQSPDSNHLVEPKNRLFVLEFENDTQRTSSKRYYLPNVEIKAYNLHSWRSKRNCLGIFTMNCKSFVNATTLSSATLLNNLIFISIKWHNTTGWTKGYQIHSLINQSQQ